MEVRIKETGEVVSLQCIDPRTGVDWMPDLIGNSGGFADDQFDYDNDAGVFVADQWTVEWWQEYAMQWEEIQQKIVDLSCRFEIDEETIRDRLADACGPDYEDHYRIAVTVLSEIESEN